MRHLCTAIALITFAAAAEEKPGDVHERARKLLERDAAETRLKRQEREVEIDRHVQAGKQLLANFDYELAHKEFQRALALDPKSTEARRMLEQTEGLLGVRKGRIKSAVEELAAERRVTIEEQKLVITNLIETAKKYIKQAETDPELHLSERLRKYELALAQLERAKELLNWMPVGEQPSGMKRQLGELMDLTEDRSGSTKKYINARDREEAAKRK